MANRFCLWTSSKRKGGKAWSGLQLMFALMISSMPLSLMQVNSGCKTFPNTAFKFSWLYYISEDNILYFYPGLNYLRNDEAGEAMRVLDMAWTGSEGDCCNACCQNPFCIQAVYYPQTKSGPPSCNLMFFDAYVSQVPSKYTATVLSGCAKSPAPSPTDTLPSGPPPGGSSNVVLIIVGSAIGAAALLAVVLGILLWRRRRRRRAEGSQLSVQPTSGDWMLDTWAPPSSAAKPGEGSEPLGVSTTGATTLDMTATGTPGHWGSEATAFRALLGRTPLEALETQLDTMHKSGTLLQGRYKLGDKSDRRVGGQGIVQFALHGLNVKKCVALKFYLDRPTFDAEQAYLCNPALHDILPAVEDIVDNDDKSITSLGLPLPPYVVIERGESLNEWQNRANADFFQSMTIINHLFLRIAALHEAGIVHRDLKPANVISYPARNEWTIIDFASAAKIGATAPFACTLAYAAPEIVLALLDGEKTHVADPAVDVWALGVMSWELLTRARVFPPGSHSRIEQCMRGKDTLPWEGSGAATEASLRRLGFMKPTVLAMLQRDPDARISARDALDSWRAWFQQESTMRV